MSADAQREGPRAADAPFLEVQGICQDFPKEGGGSTSVLKDISFSAQRHETICLLGPSGCGKSTVLRMISGMYDRRVPMPTRGAVRIGAQEVRGPHDQVLTVFQRPVLKAWLDVRGNVLLPFRAGLWGQGVSKTEREARADEALAAVSLTQAAKLYPRQLSGGMQQRVSLAARLVLRPTILCLDEPFSALDAQTRHDMQELVLKLWKQYPCLALFVTHDVEEALRVADRIIVLGTRPATIVVDVTILEPKPRPEGWFRSDECLRLEQQILARIRDAVAGRNVGTAQVST